MKEMDFNLSNLYPRKSVLFHCFANVCLYIALTTQLAVFVEICVHQSFVVLARC